MQHIHLMSAVKLIITVKYVVWCFNPSKQASVCVCVCVHPQIPKERANEADFWGVERVIIDKKKKKFSIFWDFLNNDN